MQHQWPKPGNEPFKIPDIRVTDHTTRTCNLEANTKRSTLPNWVTE